MEEVLYYQEISFEDITSFPFDKDLYRQECDYRYLGFILRPTTKRIYGYEFLRFSKRNYVYDRYVGSGLIDYYGDIILSVDYEILKQSSYFKEDKAGHIICGEHPIIRTSSDIYNNIYKSLKEQDLKIQEIAKKLKKLSQTNGILNTEEQERISSFLANFTLSNKKNNIENYYIEIILKHLVNKKEKTENLLENYLNDIENRHIEFLEKSLINDLSLKKYLWGQYLEEEKNYAK